MERCPWCLKEQIYIDYHDNEWGIPRYDDKTLFEALLLDGAQAGLSWITILKKRENYRSAFDNFDPEKIANYNDKKITELLNNQGIVRNRLKINSFINNSKAYLRLIEKNGSLSKILWQFVNNKPIKNSWELMSQVPTKTKESDEMSKALKDAGFNFVGSTICYAFMQAVGMVNDHLASCYRYKEI
ncbi:MAG TPA: DNA-3-methyladenine glycosylase I [Spirochaetota bacterium]|mgnify:CR=1 FL=1|nr:DNA-3-methyladenine glycosylase I [Spirochaetota bacterium]